MTSLKRLTFVRNQLFENDEKMMKDVESIANYDGDLEWKWTCFLNVVKDLFNFKWNFTFMKVLIIKLYLILILF